MKGRSEEVRRKSTFKMREKVNEDRKRKKEGTRTVIKKGGLGWEEGKKERNEVRKEGQK